MTNKKLNIMQQVAKIEISGLIAISEQLPNNLGMNILEAVDKIKNSLGNIIFCGVGKSGLIANKIAATFTSTGTPSIFLHGTEASHGDLGIIKKEDILFFLSNSGETIELKNALLFAKKRNIPVISITSNDESYISKNSDISLVLPKYTEACPNSLAPTTSTTMQLLLGDIIAVTLMIEKSVTQDDFKSLHPSGKIGATLLSIKEVMHTGDKMPLASQNIKIADALITMTQKRFGCIGLIDKEENLIGIITDGDLRRCLTGDILKKDAKSIMTKNPITTNSDATVINAISLMNNEKITCLFVVSGKKPVGIIHLHDLLNLSAV